MIYINRIVINILIMTAINTPLSTTKVQFNASRPCTQLEYIISLNNNMLNYNIGMATMHDDDTYTWESINDFFKVRIIKLLLMKRKTAINPCHSLKSITIHKLRRVPCSTANGKTVYATANTTIYEIMNTQYREYDITKDSPQCVWSLWLSYNTTGIINGVYIRDEINAVIKKVQFNCNAYNGDYLIESDNAYKPIKS